MGPPGGPIFGPAKNKDSTQSDQDPHHPSSNIYDASWQLGRSRQWRCQIFYVLWLQKWSLQECHLVVSCGLAFSQLPPMSGTFCGLVVVPLWSHCGPAALLQFTIQTSWCGLVVVSLFTASANVSDVLRSVGDSGNYNTIERVPTPYLPNQPLRILVQNFPKSQGEKCSLKAWSSELSHTNNFFSCANSQKNPRQASQTKNV